MRRLTKRLFSELTFIIWSSLATGTRSASWGLNGVKIWIWTAFILFSGLWRSSQTLIHFSLLREKTFLITFGHSTTESPSFVKRLKLLVAKHLILIHQFNTLNCYTSLYLSKVRVDLEQISCVPKMSRRFYKIIGDGGHAARGGQKGYWCP